MGVSARLNIHATGINGSGGNTCTIWAFARQLQTTRPLYSTLTLNPKTSTEAASLVFDCGYSWILIGSSALKLGM